MNTHDPWSEWSAGDLPAAHDAAFTLAVLRRLERRRLWRTMAAVAFYATVALLGLSTLTPVLNDMTALIVTPEILGAAAIVLLTALSVGADEFIAFDLDS